jgi:hypothetical protein
MHEGRAAVGKAMRELMARWAETKSQWSDTTSRAFETRHLTSLEMDHRQAVGAMDAMAQILQQIKRDCQ